VRQLDIPMPEFKEESVPQRSESRRELSGRDADKGVRREQRKESPKMAAGKSSKKIKPANIGLHEKKGVSEVLSEDFLFGDFYDDRGVRKRKQSRQKRSKDQGKHIPPKAVLTHIRIPESLTVKELAEA